MAKQQQYKLKRPILIHWACNDPDNGNFAYHVGNIEIGNESKGAFLKLVACWYEGVHCDRMVELLSSRIRISRQWFPVESYGTWIGNWCWDAFWMEARTVATLLNYLRAMEYRPRRTDRTRCFVWSPDAASTELWQKWDSGEAWTIEDLREIE